MAAFQCLQILTTLKRISTYPFKALGERDAFKFVTAIERIVLNRPDSLRYLVRSIILPCEKKQCHRIISVRIIKVFAVTGNERAVAIKFCQFVTINECVWVQGCD